MKKKHILFVSCIDYSAWGGSEELWSQAAIVLKERGNSVSASVGSLMARSPNCSKMKGLGISILGRSPVRLQRVKNIIYNEILKQHRDFQKRELKRWILENPPALIVINQPTNHDGTEWVEFLKMISIPYVTVSQAAADFQWPSDHNASLLREFYTNSLCNYFVSNHNHRLTEWQVGSTIPNYRVISNPFKVDFSQKFDWSFQNDTPKLAVVARLEPHSKGHDLLFLALNELNRMGFKAHFSLFGGGSNRDIMSRMIKRLGLTNITIEGIVDDICKIWKHHEMLVLPSRSEGFPLALIEAALCGRPAIVTDVGGNAELVEDGVTGYLIEAREVQSVVECLQRAVSERNKWEEMGRKMFVKARMTIPESPIMNFADMLENFLNELI